VHPSEASAEAITQHVTAGWDDEEPIHEDHPILEPEPPEEFEGPIPLDEEDLEPEVPPHA